MNILHIATDATGGAGNAMLRLHQSLLDNNLQSKVLVRDTYDYKEVYVAQVETIKGFLKTTKIGRFITRLLHKLGLYWNYRDFLITKRKNTNNKIVFTLPISEYRLDKHPLVEWADIIHLHWIQDFVDYPTFFSNINKPIIWTFHDLNPMMGGFHHVLLKEKYYKQFSGLEDKCYEVKEKALKLCTNLSVVALSNEMYDRITTHDIYHNKRVYQIPNCVDRNIFNRNKDIKSLKIKYDIPTDKRIILFANGNLNDPEKGLVELLEAIQLLDNDNIVLLCVGDGNLPKYPFIKRIPRVMSASVMSEVYLLSDLLVMPSHQEAFPLTPLEAMSCGVPVVITPVSGAIDMMTEYTGIIASDFSSISIANAIKKALIADFIPEKIIAHINEKFTPPIVCDKYIDAYSEL